jgi:beta-galactosidase GanA
VLAQKVCPDAPGTCNSVAALFDTESYRIYLRDTLNPTDPMDNSFIVHELVHVLQFKKFGHDYFTSCRKVLDSEQQAYYVQNNYLGEEGIDWREGFLLRFMKCPPEEVLKDELGRDVD